jgi:ADP-ribose pyrophosphatase YjhB (NUDIX family)
VHHIQRKILLKLLYAEWLAYSQMRPTGVESNHFAYHLEQLVHAGIVAKTGKQYSLAPKGLAMVDRMSQEKMVDRLQPHILTVIDITNDSGQTLLFKRGFQPYIHTYSFPLGKTHMDETVEEAAVRELQEKTGLTGIPLTQRGIAYTHITQQDVTITKSLCHVFSGTIKGTPPVETPAHRGLVLWADALAFTPEQMMPGFLEIKQLLAAQRPGLFFAEFSFALN